MVDAGFDGRRDVERAVSELAERLPGPLVPLARLTFNYRWSWAPGGVSLFHELDPLVWKRSYCNPRWMVESLPPRRLRQLADDPVFVKRIAELAAALDADLARAPLACGVPPDRPVAYFCSEFGAHCSLPLYGGGLGVLAGDILKAASDLAVPMVGVGLLYREGYFRQRLDLAGMQHEYWQPTDYERLPAVPVTGPDDRPLCVELEIRGRKVRIQAWRIDFGRVPLYLLDTDRPDNHPIDRWITGRLYIGDRHTRLAQYAVLGPGGFRMLRAMGLEPGVVHLNEGHAALGTVEAVGQLMEGGAPLEEAIETVRRQTVFTTHTPVAAGNEWYHRDEADPVLSGWRPELPVETFYALARMDPKNQAEPVSTTPLALRMSRSCNGVSRRHGEVARRMWQPLWPERKDSEVPIGHVTNGVHVPTWMSQPIQALLDRHLGAGWRESAADPELWSRIDSIPDEALWETRSELRRLLVEFLREQSILTRLGRGEPHDYVEAAARVFDPDTLTLGFARRVATYKRLYLLTRQLHRGLSLLGNEERPIQLVIAGKAHPQDGEAKETLSAVMQTRRAPGVAERIVFLEDYDLHQAPRLVAGVDLWLNLPRPPLEACGTSGMKVVLNGGLNLSVLDGWWEEAFDGTNGWGIATPEGDPRSQDDHDAAALFDLLEREIVPLFYERGEDGIPHAWLARVKASMRGLIPRFGANRMLMDYVEGMYAPASARG